MRTRLLLGGSAAVLVMLGAGVELRLSEGEPRAAFIDPLVLARSICGGEADAPAQRRAFFARLGKAWAAENADETPAPGADAAAPPQIGAIAYEISTESPAAQHRFNLGVAHMWNFNHGEAINQFRAAQADDPGCAMCYWGEAFAYGPNINAPMEEDARAPAFAAMSKAAALKENASEKERALIDALTHRYKERPVEDRSALDDAFAEAMGEVAAAYPDDDFVASLAAEANMDAQAWDYWMSDGRTPKGRTAETVSLLEAVLARNPDYVPAIHLYIHITEATRDPYRAAPYADRLAELSPGLGHLIHMPSHTYYRIGRFKQSLDVNIDAVKADEAFLSAYEPSPFYQFGYYVHNVHFVMMSAHMLGDAKTALEMATKLDGNLPAEMAAAVPFAQPIKAAPYYSMAQFAAPADILALPDPGDDLPFLKALWRYARGEAFARTGDAAGARGEAEAIGAIVAGADLAPLEENGVPALDILNIARLTVLARAAAAEGDYASAIEAMEEAVFLQDNIAYTEPPYWYYPAKQTLAAFVLRQGDTERAEHLFLEALAENPGNGWVLYGLAETYRAQGDRNAARFADGLFKRAWAGDARTLALSRL